MKIISDPANFQEQISNYKITVVEFYYDAIGSGRMTSFFLEDLAKECADVEFFRFNLFENETHLEIHHLTKLPTLKIYIDSKVYKVFEGFPAENRFRKTFEEAKML